MSTHRIRAALLGLLTVVIIRLATDMAIPGWATNAFGLLLIILFQAITSSVISSPSFLSLRFRSARSFRV